MSTVIECEVSYTSVFSETYDYNEYIEFRDHLLPDMYFHNFILIKNKDKMKEIITDKLKERNRSFLRFEINDEFDENLLENLNPKPSHTKYQFMSICPKDYHLLRQSDCQFVEVRSNELFNQGRQLEAKMSEALGEFANRKMNRKILVYKTGQVKYFLCLSRNQVIGSCEMFINGEVAKIDEFGILDNYQRKGYGTAFLRYLLEYAEKSGVKMAYVVTDVADTAKDMYTKCGFKTVGVKNELFFKF